jgi:hypothetical protein
MLSHVRTPYIPFTVTICGVGQPQLRFITGIVHLLGRMLLGKGPSFPSCREDLPHSRRRVGTVVKFETVRAIEV